ncbi:MAG: hypothetical protein ACYTBR_14485 [Planctomycetota bacterium]|jgi:hypothetical protein
MMYGDRQTTDDLVFAVLKRHAPAVKEVGPGAWDLRLVNGAVSAATARARSGWLTLDLELSGRALPDDYWALLHRNAGTGAGVKFVLDETGRSCRLRAELALDLDEPAELEAHVEALVARVKDASANLRRKKAQAKDRDGATADVAPAPIARYVEEAGWPFVERSEGRVAVPLEVSRRVIHAVVEPTPEGGVVVSAALTNGEVPPAGANREALAVLLLTVTGRVHLARASALDQPGGGVATRLETVLPPACNAQHLHHALSALSVACRLCVLEAEVLHADAVVAETCLVSWGGPGADVHNES